MNHHDDELVPGTVHLVDLEGDLQVKKEHGDIILRPPPSSNPNDPLRWSQKKKNLQFFFLFVLNTVFAISSNWSGPVWTEWTEVFDCSFTQLNITSAVCFLFLGMGCLFLQPTAMKLGRRFVYLLCTVLQAIGCIIGGTSKNIGALYAVNVFVGFGAAPCDSLVEISTTDVFFQHERASYMAWVIFALYFGCDIGPTITGYISENIGWRWSYWIQLICYGVLFIIGLFYMEDTNFTRGESDENIETEILEQIKSRESKVQTHEEVKHIGDSDNESIDHSIPTRGYWQRMRIWDTEYNDTRSWLCIFYRPFFMIGFPAIIWGGLVYGAQMMWLSLLATTQSEIYAVPPYNFSAGSVGLTNLAPLVGSIIGLSTGKIVDKVTIYLARRNGGIMEPEFRLHVMLLPLLTNAAGLLAYGLGSVNGANWPVSVVLGQGFLGYAMSSSGTICLTYAIDCYHLMASEGMVLMLFIRNMIGMGFTFAIQPWLDRDGLKNTTWIMFALSLVINGSYILMIFYGKTFRKWTKNSYYRFSDPNFGELFKKN